MLRFIRVICDRTAPPLRAEHAGASAANLQLRAWREDHPPAALGKHSASPALDQPQPKMANEPAAPTLEMHKLSHPSP